MLALARGSDNGLLSARRIADAMAIPVRFLPQVLGDLQRSALVRVRARAGRRLPPGEARRVDQPAGGDRGRRGREPPPDVRAARRPMRHGRSLRRPRRVLPRPGGAAERPGRHEPRVAGGSKGRRGAHRGRRQLTSALDGSGARPENRPNGTVQINTKLVIVLSDRRTLGADEERTYRHARDSMDRGSGAGRDRHCGVHLRRGAGLDISTDRQCRRRARRPPRPRTRTRPVRVAGTLTITAFDLGFKPASLTVPAAGRYAITLDNTGSTAHDVTFPDGTKIAAAAGATGTGEVDVTAAGLVVPVLDPRARGGGDAGRHHGRRRDGRHNRWRDGRHGPRRAARSPTRTPPRRPRSPTRTPPPTPSATRRHRR